MFLLSALQCYFGHYFACNKYNIRTFPSSHTDFVRYLPIIKYQSISFFQEQFLGSYNNFFFQCQKFIGSYFSNVNMYWFILVHSNSKLNISGFGALAVRKVMFGKLGISSIFWHFIDQTINWQIKTMIGRLMKLIIISSRCWQFQ